LKRKEKVTDHQVKLLQEKGDYDKTTQRAAAEKEVM
jgi:hypothetical protein